MTAKLIDRMPLTIRQGRVVDGTWTQWAPDLEFEAVGRHYPARPADNRERGYSLGQPAETEHFELQALMHCGENILPMIEVFDFRETFVEALTEELLRQGRRE